MVRATARKPWPVISSLPISIALSDQESVVAHRPSATTSAREYVRSLSCEVIQGPEDCKSLPSQWNDVINLCLRDSITPLCVLQVDVSPDSGAKLARAHKEQGSQPQS
jgi:hypothetical protein